MRLFDEDAVSIPFLTAFRQQLVLNLVCKDCVEIKCPSEVKFDLTVNLKWRRGSKIQVFQIKSLRLHYDNLYMAQATHFFN